MTTLATTPERLLQADLDAANKRIAELEDFARAAINTLRTQDPLYETGKKLMGVWPYEARK